MQRFDWHGFETEREDPEPGVARLLVKPPEGVPPALDDEGRPLWYWNVHFWGAFPFTELALLPRGWHVAHATVDELYGGPECMRRMDGLYDALVARGFSRRPVLVGMSRGGLDVANWAVRHPDGAGALVFDNAVLDLRSWPLGLGRSPELSAERAAARRAWGLPEDGSGDGELPPPPRDTAPAALARAGTPVLVLQALADRVVPPEDNGLPFFDRLVAAGGFAEKIEKPGSGHHPHGLEPPDRILDFLDRALSRPRAPLPPR